MWQTYTPDGSVLALRLQDGLWIATCLGARAEAATAEEAIRGVLARREAFGRRGARGVDRRPRRRARRGGAGELTQAAPSARPSAASRNSCSSGVPTETRIAVGAPKPASGRTITPCAEQPLEERRCVLAEVDVEEVADGARRRARGRGARRIARELDRGPAAFSARRRAISPASSRLASAATCAVVVTSNGRRTFAIAAQTSRGPTA